MIGGIQAQLTGTVTAHFKSGIRVLPDGGKGWVTVWTGERPPEQTHVTVAGVLTSKAEESHKEPGKWFGVAHINDATITAAAPVAVVRDQPWDTTPTDADGGYPF